MAELQFGKHACVFIEEFHAWIVNTLSKGSKAGEQHSCFL